MVTSIVSKPGSPLTSILRFWRNSSPEHCAAKLLDAVGKQYCDEHGLTFTKVNPPQEMLDARDAYVAQLFAQAEGDITYYKTGA